jgi:hypothetical protein
MPIPSHVAIRTTSVVRQAPGNMPTIPGSLPPTIPPTAPEEEPVCLLCGTTGRAVFVTSMVLLLGALVLVFVVVACSEHGSTSRHFIIRLRRSLRGRTSGRGPDNARQTQNDDRSGYELLDIQRPQPTYHRSRSGSPNERGL